MDSILKAGIDLIQNGYVQYVIEYLKTGHFNQPNNAKFVVTYSYVFLTFPEIFIFSIGRSWSWLI